MSAFDDVTGPFDPKRALQPDSVPPPAPPVKPLPARRSTGPAKPWERLIAERDAALAEVARLRELLGEDADQ